MSTERKKTHGVANMIAGGVGGFFVVLTGHPFDTIKVRMQTARVPAPGQSIHFNGAIECLRQTVTKEGFTGLYKGMGAPLAGVSPLFALYFFGCSFAKRMQQKHPDEVLSTLQNFNAGAFAGFLTTVVIAPAERIKCLLQIQHDKSDTRFRGPIDVVKRLYKEGGIRSIYRGTAATLLRDVPASGAYFASYEYLMIKLTPEGKRQACFLGYELTFKVLEKFVWAFVIKKEMS
uniref:Uncharacterized protein n=1 Tax=Romanomermis culicivorax TaxID=13658 RepID=A0A915JWU4_ROMCU